MKVGDITLDGHKVGYVDLAMLEGDDQRLTSTPHADIGSDAPLLSPDELGGRSGTRDVVPGTKDKPLAKQKQPTFRPGLTPRGGARPAKPPEFTVDDVQKAIHGKDFGPGQPGRGHIDRSKFEEELKAKPWLRDKIMRIMANEQGSHPEGTQAIVESMMNRAQMRGTSLEAQAKWTGERGYYAQGNMGRGALENARHRAILEKGLNAALAGSNISNYATDNSSGGLARREAATGKFIPTYSAGGETFFRPGSAERTYRDVNYPRWRAEVEQADTAPPRGITRLGADPEDQERIARQAARLETPNVAAGPVDGEPGDIKPIFPYNKDVNISRLSPEMIARLNAAYRAAPDSDKFTVISGYRPATREEARTLGMSEHSSQEDIWERSGHGTRFAAAPPGRSRHQAGEAVDIGRQGMAWMMHHRREFGLEEASTRRGPSYDPGHQQLSRTWQGGDFAARERKIQDAARDAAKVSTKDQ